MRSDPPSNGGEAPVSIPTQMSMYAWVRYDRLSTRERRRLRVLLLGWRVRFSARGRTRPIVYVLWTGRAACIFRKMRGGNALSFRLLGHLTPPETIEFASLLSDISTGTGLPVQPALSSTRVQKPKRGPTVQE